ncbi:hypothetical protein Tco_1134866 [Tanacetum coccineum]
MSWFMRCSWCGGPFNGGNCRRYTNVSFRDEFVRNPDPISYDETADFSYPPPQPKSYSCELCGNDSHYGYDCPLQCQSRNQNYFESNPCYNLNSYGFDQPTQTSIDHQTPKEMSVQEFLLHKALQAICEKLNQQEHAANVSTHTLDPSRRFNFIYDDDDDDEESTIPLNKIISQIPPSIAITPVLPTMELEDSLIMGDENLSTIPEKESDEFIKSSVEDLVSIPKKSSGSTTTHSGYSFPDYKAFYFDDNHIKEKSSGSTTTHFDFSLPEYDSFIFDLLIDPFRPADRSVFHHEEFADELDHIISPPEYDYFYFDLEANPGELTILFEENISKDSTKEFTSLEINDFPLLLSDCDSTFSEEFYEIDLLVLFPSGNKDKVFDPGIFIIKRVQSKRFHIFPLEDFPTFSFVSDSLLLINPSEIETFLSFPSGNEDKVFDPEILVIDGVFSFTRKSPHLLINNFLIDKCHILSEISLMTESSVSFHPKDKEIRGESS